MAGVYGRYVGDVNTSLSVLTSDNGGRDWHYLAVAANATGTGPDHVCGSASEHDFVTLDDGSILGVYRCVPALELLGACVGRTRGGRA